MRCSPTAGSWWLARATARWWRSSGRSATPLDGFFSLEPHFGEYTEFGALSGPELFTRAWRPLPNSQAGRNSYA